MRRSLSHSLSLVGLCILLSLISGANVQAQSVIGEILRRIDINSKAIKVLRADVKMVKFSAPLKVSDTSEGNITYLPKNRNQQSSYARLNWKKPVEEQLSLIGNAYELYRPRLNQVIVGDIQKAKDRQELEDSFGFLNMSKNQIKAKYSRIVYVGQEKISDGTSTAHLQFTPKAPSDYKALDLWVDRDGMTRLFKILEKNGDTTSILLLNIENTTLKDLAFKLKYPTSVKKINGN